jgi:hypothetical protein
LQHELEELGVKNHGAPLQTIVEIIKCLVGWQNLQPHMTLQSLGKHVKQESEEGTSKP